MSMLLLCFLGDVRSWPPAAVTTLRTSSRVAVSATVDRHVIAALGMARHGGGGNGGKPQFEEESIEKNLACYLSKA